MSVHDAWPCFLRDCGEEMHCGSSMWRGGCSPRGSQQAKKRKGPESAYLQQGMPARDSPSSNQDSPLSVPSAANSAPDQFFSKWASGANSPKPQSLWIYPGGIRQHLCTYTWGNQAPTVKVHSLCRLLCKKLDRTLSMARNHAGLALYSLWLISGQNSWNQWLGQLCTLIAPMFELDCM